MFHLLGSISNLPEPEVAITLFSRTYLRTDMLPACETFAVESAPYCGGGIRMRFGITAHAEACHTEVIAKLKSARISSGVLVAQTDDAEPPTGRFVTLVTSVLLSRPVAPFAVS